MYIVLDDLFFLVVLFFRLDVAVRKMRKGFSKIRQSWLFASTMSRLQPIFKWPRWNRKFTADRSNTLPDWVRACWIYIGRFEGILCHRASSRFKIKANRIFFHDVWPRRSLVAGTKENYPPVINPHPRRYVLKTNSFERDLRVEFSFGNKFVNCLWKRYTIYEDIRESSEIYRGSRRKSSNLATRKITTGLGPFIGFIMLAEKMAGKMVGKVSFT